MAKKRAILHEGAAAAVCAGLLKENGPVFFIGAASL